MKLLCSNHWQNPQITAADNSCWGKKGVLKKFADFIGKHLCWSQFLIKLQLS